MKNKGCSKKSERKEIEIFSTQEVELILSEAMKKRYDYYSLFLTLFRTGRRLGEAVGLTWGDIAFNTRIIKVGKSGRNGIMSSTKRGKRG